MNITMLDNKLQWLYSYPNTPLARLRHKERWSDYAKGLLESYSIEKSNLAISTSFR
jgi:hypothetical protein